MKYRNVSTIMPEKYRNYGCGLTEKKKTRCDDSCCSCLYNNAKERVWGK